MEVRRLLAPVDVRVAVDTTGGDAPETDHTEHDQQDSTEHLAAALDDEREGPAQDDQAARAESQKQRVPDGETDGHAHRARAPQRRRFPRRADRQRGDRHEVIGAETMKKTQGKGGSEKQHFSIVDSLTRD
jgi:hypothetical protein